MIVAFFRDNQEHLYKNNGELLMDLLKFYGDKFNPKEMGISLIEPLFCFFYFLLKNLLGSLSSYLIKSRRNKTI